MTKANFFPAGTPITFTSGEYSDFSIVGQIVTIRDCDLPKLAQKYVTEKNPAGERYGDEIEDFVAWLVVKEHAMPMAGQTVHLGDYSTFDDELVPRPGQ